MSGDDRVEDISADFKQWMLSKFEEQKTAMTVMKSDIEVIRAHQQVMQNDVQHLNLIAVDIKELVQFFTSSREAFEQMTRIVKFVVDKRTWMILAVVMFMANWLPEHLSWPF